MHRMRDAHSPHGGDDLPQVVHIAASVVLRDVSEFPDDATCLEHLWRARYSPDGEHAYCPSPSCKRERTFKRYETKQQRQSWTCTACGTHIHPTAGTIFHKSSTSLHLWFYVMYL